MGAGGFISDLFETVFGKGIKQGLLPSNFNLSAARNILEFRSTGIMNNAGITAARDIELQTAKGVTLSFKKGESIVAKNMDEFNAINKQFRTQYNNATKDVKSGLDGMFAYKADGVTKSYIDNIVTNQDFYRFKWDLADGRMGGILEKDSAYMKFIGREGKEGLGVVNTANAYFNDSTYGTLRKQAAIGGTAATGVALRYLSGGNLTTKANGERNIAGIPFI